MACIDILDVGLCPVGHEHKLGRRDDVISGADERPGWDGQPRRNSRCFRSGAQRERPMANRQLGGLLRGHAVSEALGKARVSAVRPDFEVNVLVSGWAAGVGHGVETGAG